MTTPMNPVPALVARWMARVRWLRWLDACVAWAGLWCLGGAVLGRGLAGPAAGLALLLVGLGLWVRAWYVRPHQADLVLVTARHGARLVIARPNLAEDEGLTVRRTRVLVLPADGG